MGYFRVERGMLWPADDTECAAAVFDELVKIKPVVNYCKARRTVVQAGGNCGVFPIALVEYFEKVFTFEPDDLNFACLAANCGGNPRIVKYQAALGDEADLIYMDRVPGNCGAHQVAIGGGGKIPMLRLDDLVIENVDLIWLDIEGMEKPALRGASEILRRDHPVIVVEDKGLSARYGSAEGEVVRWLEKSFGYQAVARLMRDTVLV